MIDQSELDGVSGKDPKLKASVKLCNIIIRYFSSLEMKRLFLCIMFLFLTLLLTSFALELSDYYRLPEPLLPDLVHDNIIYIPAEELINFFISVHVVYIVIRILLHPNRFVILRQSLMVYSLTMLLRTGLLLSFSIPEGNPACRYNRRKLDFHAIKLIRKLFGGRTCGDLIYSGHTIGLFLPALVQGHYFGGAFTYIISFSASIQSFLVIASKLHYGIDVALAIIALSLIFWTYINVAEKQETFKNICKPFSWYFKLMEWNVENK